MGYARTKRGAKYRVTMKRALWRKGFKIDSKIATKELEKKYRLHVGSCPKR